MGILNWKGLPVLSGRAWQGVRYFSTLRMAPGWTIDTGGGKGWAPAGGASSAPFDTFNLGDHVGDDMGAVRINRQRLAAALPSEPVWLQQIHGTDVYDADMRCLIPWSDRVAKAGAALPAGVVPTADAAITQTKGRVLCIMTADCLPVLLSNDEGTIVGLAHAGWRGLAHGVLEATMAALQERVPHASWRAWIGPAISQAAFEVGDEVRQLFVEHDKQAVACFKKGRPQRWLADLPALAAQRLKNLGVSSIDLSGLCTHAERDLFYSYRRDGATGRMVTVAWLES